MLGVGDGGPVAEEPSRREKEQVANTCFKKNHGTGLTHS